MRNLMLFPLLAAVAGVAVAKSGRTYFTDERIAVAKENIARYEWAQRFRHKLFEVGDPITYYTGQGNRTAANKFAEQSDEFIWLLQPTTRIARVVWPPDTIARCPICGDAVKKISVWNHWRIDPLTHPYQVQCQMCKNWFPTNKYHEGDMTSGQFPDDGEGCLYQGLRYFFLREYAHMVYGTVVVPTLTSLSEAYVLTGDPKYAHKGCILLARLASEYPNYGWDADPAHGLPAITGLENRFDRTYLGPWNNRHPHYDWKHGGMITDLIWETWNLEYTAYAYDGLYDYMDKDPEMIAFLRSKGLPVENGDDLRRYIENYIFRAGMRALIQGEIQGNEGFHQAAALAVALVMDDYGKVRPNSKDMVDYAYHGAGHSAYILVNGLTRDGGGHESIGYNRIKCDFIRVARLMEEVRRRHPELYPPQKYPDLFDNPKAKALFDYFIDSIICDRFLPPIGDAGGIGKPSRNTGTMFSYLTHENIYAVLRYGDPRHARACTDPRDGSLATGELWEPYPADKISELLARPESRIVRPSRVLDGYGIAFLESGTRPNDRGLYLNYTSLRGHRQQDNLTIGLYARGLDLLPDLGYPRTWDYRWQWDAASMSHNTVTVNESEPATGAGGIGRLFASVGGVHVAVASHDPYPPGHDLGRKDAPPVDLYERMVVLVDVDDERFYVVDLFSVNGGEQHDQSWHAMLVAPEPPPLDWQAQERGTLAGADVPEFSGYTDRWGRERKAGFFPSFLTEVRRARLFAPAAWTWKSGLPEGDTLRLQVVPLGGPAEAIMGRGRSPVWKEDKLDYLIVRRTVEGGAPSRFLTVLDAFQSAPVVQGVRVVEERPLRIEVTRADGVDELTLNVPDGPSRTTAHRPVGVRVRSTTNGRVCRDVRIGATGDGAPGYYSTSIAAVDYEKQAIAVPEDGTAADALAVGRTIRIFNPERSGLYRIVSVRPEGKSLWLTLDRTALLARGPVRAVDTGVLYFDAHFTFASYGGFAGARAGDNERSLTVRDATTDGAVRLKSQVPAQELAQRFSGKVVSLWEYGVRDSVEVPLLRAE